MLELACYVRDWPSSEHSLTIAANVNAYLVAAMNPSLRNCRPVLACLLLLTIGYGALIDTVHSHGTISSQQITSSFCDAGGSQSSQDGRSSHRECTMCQFQRQLIDGFVHAPSFAVRPSIEIAVVTTAVVRYASTSTSPRSGRAPPLV